MKVHKASWHNLIFWRVLNLLVSYDLVNAVSWGNPKQSSLGFNSSCTLCLFSRFWECVVSIKLDLSVQCLTLLFSFVAASLGCIRYDV